MEHPIRQFRRAAKIGFEDFAKRLGISGASLSRIETGKQSPTMEIARRVMRETDGQVTANDLMHAQEPAE
jgi:DNA-binding XRE family transcriptional regulator